MDQYDLDQRAEIDSAHVTFLLLGRAPIGTCELDVAQVYVQGKNYSYAGGLIRTRESSLLVLSFDLPFLAVWQVLTCTTVPMLEGYHLATVFVQVDERGCVSLLALTKSY